MELLKHECGVAMVRLLKPLDYYVQKYGNRHYGLDKLYLLMEKQHNRGQEGAGMVCVNLEAQPGEEYMRRERAVGSSAIADIFQRARTDTDFCGEAYMGHLRYSTTGKGGLAYVHPLMRRNNWRARNLSICGNFNLTNVDDVFSKITATGQHPRLFSDTYIMLELMGHRLDRESERVYNIAIEHGLQETEITTYIENNIEVANVLRTATPMLDGGYVMCGLTGSGEMFAMRDPWGIRPAFWYSDDEVVVLASERPVIQTVFNVKVEKVSELQAGQALIVKKNGLIRTEQILQSFGNHACSFERIYFSRGSDCDIYRERKALGEQLTNPINDAIEGDVEHTVFGYIPNTAEVAFYGMLDGFKKKLNESKVEKLYELTHHHQPTKEELSAVLHNYIRSEKVAVKDIKLRTFISESGERNDLAAHVYDITYGSLQPLQDNLVIIDDSIVRGTTLKESIIRILDRLQPKKMVLVSSCPQVRYPDYYGIDMSRMEEFIAFRAAVALHLDRDGGQLLNQIYENCVREDSLSLHEMRNRVTDVYAPFSAKEISAKMVELLRPDEVTTPIELVFQTLEGLHTACPNHPGDWYFSGIYPTPGGIRQVNKAYINYYRQMVAGSGL